MLWKFSRKIPGTLYILLQALRKLGATQILLRTSYMATMVSIKSRLAKRFSRTQTPAERHGHPITHFCHVLCAKNAELKGRHVWGSVIFFTHVLEIFQ
jgi:hypothetical protein